MFAADTGDLFASSSGSALCSALVKAYDTVLLKPLDQCYTAKLTCVSALKALLAVSTSAKMAALEGKAVLLLCHLVIRCQIILKSVVLGEGF